MHLDDDNQLQQNFEGSTDPRPESLPIANAPGTHWSRRPRDRAHQRPFWPPARERFEPALPEDLRVPWGWLDLLLLVMVAIAGTFVLSMFIVVGLRALRRQLPSIAEFDQRQESAAHHQSSAAVRGAADLFERADAPAFRLAVLADDRLAPAADGLKRRARSHISASFSADSCWRFWFRSALPLSTPRLSCPSNNFFKIARARCYS